MEISKMYRLLPVLLLAFQIPLAYGGEVTGKVKQLTSYFPDCFNSGKCAVVSFDSTITNSPDCVEAINSQSFVIGLEIDKQHFERLYAELERAIARGETVKATGLGDCTINPRVETINVASRIYSPPSDYSVADTVKYENNIPSVIDSGFSWGAPVGGSNSGGEIWYVINGTNLRGDKYLKTGNVNFHSCNPNSSMNCDTMALDIAPAKEYENGRHRILSVENGVVEEIIFSEVGYGNTIVINHGNGVYSRYAHLGDIYVNKDEVVSKSTLIALLGWTGNSGPIKHLHFAMYYKSGNTFYSFQPQDLGGVKKPIEGEFVRGRTAPEFRVRKSLFLCVLNCSEYY